MAALLPRPLAPADGGLVLQYEVQFTETHGCGGAYLKLIAHTDGWEPRRLGRKTEYCIMFGPDRCGAAARATSPLRRVAPAGAVAFKLMTIDKGYLFDGVLVAPAAGGGLERAGACRRDVWRRRDWEEPAGS